VAQATDDSVRSPDRENEAIEEAAPISSPAVFEAIRRAGVEELQRPNSALILSAFVAGIALGFSVLGNAILHRYLPDTQWRPVVESLGYSFGFVLVIMGQMQLFTENTITAVCPFLSAPRMRVFARLLRLWIIVLVFNLIGAACFGVALANLKSFQPETFEAIRDIAHHAIAPPATHVLWLGVGAGWLIAALVWMMPNSGPAKLPLIILVTWFIAVAGFSHVIAGTCEATFLLVVGEIGIREMAFGFTLPALAGNILGGTVVFTLLMWVQIRVEHNQPEADLSYDYFWETPRGSRRDGK